MRISYDPIANAANVYLIEVKPGQEVEHYVSGPATPNTAVILCFDKEHRLIKLEVLGAREILPPEVLQQAGA